MKKSLVMLAPVVACLAGCTLGIRSNIHQVSIIDTGAGKIQLDQPESGTETLAAEKTVDLQSAVATDQATASTKEEDGEKQEEEKSSAAFQVAPEEAPEEGASDDAGAVEE